MALSTNTFTYNGGAQTFTLSLSLGYLEESDITAFVVGDLDGGGDQIFRAFTFDSEFVVRLTDPLTIGDEVTVERTVSKTSFVVDFETGGDVTARNLMILYKQVFMAQQELLDGRVGDFDPTGDAASAETSAIASSVSAAEAAQSAIDAATFEPATFYTKVEADVIHGGIYTKAEQDSIDGVQNTAIALRATLASPSLTGTPTAPTAAPGDNTELLASTEFVNVAIGLLGPLGLLAVTAFTTSGTWTPHADGRSAMIYCTAGGGGGRSYNAGAGNPGSAGGTAITFIADLSAIVSEVVTVGAGGAASSGGGNSSVGALAAASGGQQTNTNGSPGGAATVGTVLLTGGGSTGANSGSPGGASFWGGGAETPAGSSDGKNGKAYGSGATGGNDNAVLKTGGTGAPGIVLILEW